MKYLLAPAFEILSSLLVFYIVKDNYYLASLIAIETVCLSGICNLW